MPPPSPPPATPVIALKDAAWAAWFLFLHMQLAHALLCDPQVRAALPPGVNSYLRMLNLGSLASASLDLMLRARMDPELERAFLQARAHGRMLAFAGWLVVLGARQPELDALAVALIALEGMAGALQDIAPLL